MAEENENVYIWQTLLSKATYSVKNMGSQRIILCRYDATHFVTLLNGLPLACIG